MPPTYLPKYLHTYLPTYYLPTYLPTYLPITEQGNNICDKGDKADKTELGQYSESIIQGIQFPETRLHQAFR